MIMASLHCIMSHVALDQHRSTSAVHQIIACIHDLPLEKRPVHQPSSLCFKIMEMLDLLGYVKEALDFSRRFPLDENQKNPLIQAKILRYQGGFLRNLGSYDQASDHLKTAASVFKQNAMPIEYAQCLNNIGLIKLELGKTTEAMELFNEAFDRIDAIDAPVLTGMLYNNRGVSASIRGELECALSDFSRGMTYSKRSHDWPGQAESLYNQSIIYRKKKKQDISLSLLEEARQLASQLKYSILIANIQLMRAELFLDQSDPVAADPLITEAKRYYENQGIWPGIAESLMIRSGVSILNGHLDHARKELTEAIRIDRMVGYKLGEALSLEKLADLAFRSGEADAGVNHLQSARELFRQLDAHLDFIRVESKLCNHQSDR